MKEWITKITKYAFLATCKSMQECKGNQLMNCETNVRTIKTVKVNITFSPHFRPTDFFIPRPARLMGLALTIFV